MNKMGTPKVEIEMENEDKGGEMSSEGGQAPEGSNPITQALMGANDMLTQLATAVEASKGMFPPEAVKSLQTAVSEYQNFMGMAVGGDMKGGAMGNTPSDVQGRAGAVPADMPMGKGIKPVPA